MAPGHLVYLALRKRVVQDEVEAALAETLAAHPAWRTGARTLAVAEGLVAYLAPETVDRLFDAVARATGPGSRRHLTSGPRFPGYPRSMSGSLSAALASLVLPDPDGREVRLGSLWEERPAVVVFLRHYG